MSLATTLTATPPASANEREAWLKWRQTGIGASEAGGVLGVVKKPTPLEIYLRKIGELPEDEENEAMSWGKKLEPLVAAEYTERTGVRLADNDLLVRSKQYPFVLASLDRRREDGVPVELKTIGLWAAKMYKLGEEGTDEVPFAWLCQGYHQMIADDSNKTDRVDIAALIGGQEFRTYTIRRDSDSEPAIRNMIKRYTRFWDCVQNRKPPEIDPEKDGDLLKILYPKTEGAMVLDPATVALVAEWERLKEIGSENEKAKKKIQAEILIAMETKETGRLPDGRLLCRSKIERAGYTVKPSSYIELRVKKGE